MLRTHGTDFLDDSLLNNNSKVVSISTDGVVTDDVLLCNTTASGSMTNIDSQFVKRRRSHMSNNNRQDVDRCTPFSSSTLLESSPMHQPHYSQEIQKSVNSIPALTADRQIHTLSDQELERRQRLRERKRVQRQNQDFADKERIRARGRIKALREDPMFREMERKRDRERRRQARLMNQTQRMQERDRDKLRKSMMRSLESKHHANKCQNNVNDNNCDENS